MLINYIAPIKIIVYTKSVTYTKQKNIIQF